MRRVKWKFKEQRGFTLVEMLIVVAIIAILIAVSIPLVNGALDKARCATDAANERAAKAAALILWMTSKDKSYSQFLYDAVSGELIPRTGSTSNVAAYGKCRTHQGYKTSTAKVNSHEDMFLFVQLDWSTGDVKMIWMKSTGTMTNPNFDWNEGLCSAQLISIP